ncbi:ABC transporter ATP-binding protein [Enterococcus sp. LJL98]
MPIIDLQEVHYIRQRKTLLQQINWKVQQGEHWALLGLNGAGKTLLLQIITGNLWPSSGQVAILGEVFGQTSLPELSKRIGWVSSALQVRLRMNELAEKIVLSGKFASIGIYQAYDENDLDQAKSLLKNLGSTALIGKTYQQLSQGEKQIVLIARALMAQPELLILDEPCTGLDLFAREELLHNIQKLADTPHAPTILFVTHHTEEIMPFISHVCLLREGTIFTQGERATILKNETLQAFYQRPIQIAPFAKTRQVISPSD